MRFSRLCHKKWCSRYLLLQRIIILKLSHHVVRKPNVEVFQPTVPVEAQPTASINSILGINRTLDFPSLGLWIFPADIPSLMKIGHAYTSPQPVEYVIIIEWLRVYNTKLCSGCPSPTKCQYSPGWGPGWVSVRTHTPLRFVGSCQLLRTSIVASFAV